MKKLIGITALAAFSLSLFSFATTPAKKASYNELKKAAFAKIINVGSFSKYENGTYTGDKGTWNSRKEVWSLTQDNGSLNAIEKVLN
jgi:hypothetical protein